MEEDFDQKIQRLICEAVVLSLDEPVVFEKPIGTVSPITKGYVVKAVNGLTILLVDESEGESYTIEESKDLVMGDITPLREEQLIHFRELITEDQKTLMWAIAENHHTYPSAVRVS